jgi:hypothetical protein
MRDTEERMAEVIAAIKAATLEQVEQLLKVINQE